ncbi:MAG: flavodoxin family protein [Oscillospiraceae bacterium]|jgi:multimeric flavodoxin WrbA|nr:flavodoxin family protein [Christensenellales bacterium]
MKVLLLNGSPHERGCTHRALLEVGKSLEAEGIQTAFFWIGKAPIIGCQGCGGCAKAGKCVFSDGVNDFVAFAKEADGFVFGAPVHYAAAAGGITAFLDRAFYSASSAGAQVFRLKPAAAIVSARRAGTTAALDQLNKYFTISQMPIISSRYWNMVHGNTPAEVEQDLEGMQVMRFLGRNMAYFLKCIEAGRKAGVPLPREEGRIATNFIR